MDHIRSLRKHDIFILGAGTWGRAIGYLLGKKGHQVHWVHHTDVEWPKVSCEVVVLALPVQHIRETLRRFSPREVPVLSLSKGLEIATGQRVSEMIQAEWGAKVVGALSGPSFAAEVVEDRPTTCVVAAREEKQARFFQDLLHQSTFRLYRSTDLIGVEIGGALKNVYALVGGICLGLELGENAFAGVMTRCLAEMTRIGVQAGGHAETFAGLSGIGDLMLTARSPLSRNHRLGFLLAEGKSLEQALEEVGGLAEGVPTTRSVYENEGISREAKPIVNEMYGILFQGKPIGEAIHDLLGRASKSE